MQVSLSCALKSCVALLVALATFSASADAATRRAFIVGNSAYQYTSVLANPASDAQDVAKRLGDLGFVTKPMTPAEFTAFVAAQVQTFRAPVKASGAKL